MQDRTPVGQGAASTTLWVSLLASTLAERWVFDMVIFRLVRGHLAHGGVVGWWHRRRRGEKRSVARSSGRRGGASAAAGGLGGSSSHLHGQISDPIGLRLHMGVCWGTGDDGSIGETRKSFSGGRVGLRAKMEEEQQILIYAPAVTAVFPPLTWFMQAQRCRQHPQLPLNPAFALTINIQQEPGPDR